MFLQHAWFENWGIPLRYSPVLAWKYSFTHYAFSLIARERKYLMDCKKQQHEATKVANTSLFCKASIWNSFSFFHQVFLLDDANTAIYLRKQLWLVNMFLKKHLWYIYLLLAEFEVRTVSYGPSFFPYDSVAQVRSARAINRRGKNEDP